MKKTKIIRNVPDSTLIYNTLLEGSIYLRTQCMILHPKQETGSSDRI